MKQPTARVRRRRKHRVYKYLEYKILRGEIQVTQELMQFVRSPIYKRRITEAIILRMTNPEEAWRRAGPGPIDRYGELLLRRNPGHWTFHPHNRSKLGIAGVLRFFSRVRSGAQRL